MAGRAVRTTEAPPWGRSRRGAPGTWPPPRSAAPRPGAGSSRWASAELGGPDAPPAVGETDVVLTPLGGLFPGVSATAGDDARAAVVKDDPRMVEVIAIAVRDRRSLPTGPVEIPLEDEPLPLRLSQRACARARERAQALRAPHNVARKPARWSRTRPGSGHSPSGAGTICMWRSRG